MNIAPLNAVALNSGGAVEEFVVESAAAADATLPDAFATFHESATATESYAPSTLRTLTLAESGTARDTLVITTTAYVVEAATATDATVTRTDSVLTESATASDALTTSTTRTLLLADAATASDGAGTGGDAVVSESATAAEAWVTGYAQNVIEAATASDALQAGAEVESSDIVEAATASDALSIQATTRALVAETATATDAFSLKAPGAVAWLMNSETGAPSWYSNFQFADLCQVGDVVLAVGPDGLAVLGADTDNGDTIDAAVTWGFTEFGGYDRDGNPKPDLQKKRVSGLWFGYTSDDVLEASIETRGEPVYMYSMPRRAADQPATNRIKPGRGLNARYWRIGINNVAGCDFAVDSLHAHFEQSSRRL